MNNIFDAIPADLPTELFETLAEYDYISLESR